MIAKVIIISILTVLIGGFIFFRLLNKWINYREIKAGKIYCEENGLTFVKAKSYELHTRLYFRKDDLDSWVNYETDRKGKITWTKESPLEKLELLKSKVK